MAHSVQEFRGRFVALNDLDIIAIVSILCGMIASGRDDDYARLLAELWRSQIEVAGPGSIDLDLDNLVDGNDRRDQFISVMQLIETRISEYGSFVPAKELAISNGLGAILTEYPADVIVNALRNLMELVRVAI